MQKIIDDEVQEILQNGIIELSASPWSFPVVNIRKKDERLCFYIKKVNEITEHDTYPLLQINNISDKLRGARYLTLDLQQGYWQIPLVLGTISGTTSTQKPPPQMPFLH